MEGVFLWERRQLGRGICEELESFFLINRIDPADKKGGMPMRLFIQGL